MCKSKQKCVDAVKHAISQTKQVPASSCYMCIILRLKISLPISRFENSNSDLINIRTLLLLVFFMTLSRNQTFRTLPNYGNVFILTQFVCEKMSLVSDEVLTETGNIQPQ